MYKFVDTMPNSDEESTSLSLQTIFNGNNLDELLTDGTGRFVTLSVGGRGILNRRFDLVPTPISHGARERSVTYDVREIPVEFLIEDKTNEGFRERFNRLNGYIKGRKKRLEFTDEQAYFVATLSSADVPDEESNSLICTMIFTCADSAKRMNEKTINITTSNAMHEISGQDETPWIVEVIFSGAMSTFELETNKGLYLLLNYNFVEGDHLTIKYNSREVLLNGNDLRHAVRLKSNFEMLEPGVIEVSVNHNCVLKYDERYY